MKCKEQGCVCEIIPSRGYCSRHGGFGRLLKEKVQKDIKVRSEKNKNRQRFQADGHVRPGMGLRRGAEQRKQAFFRNKALAEAIGDFFKKLSEIQFNEICEQKAA